MKTIFVQDSDEEILYILTAILEDANYKVYSFEECNKTFFSLISLHKPDLILLDFKLSGLDCIDALREIKTSNSEIPVIAISTNYDIQDLCSQFGFDDYLLKPFDLETLYSTIIRNLQVIN
ncbi:hypothetical protein A0256_03400 [Mucilaginibacter sp. PAMC 26640]|nr:hypothetical protein A0256_03400 [Mucilaginibacter sp. PAMC 26640]